MNWLNKLEQKYGSKAIPNITRIFIAANLNEADYVKIGKSIKRVLDEYAKVWQS